MMTDLERVELAVRRVQSGLVSARIQNLDLIDAFDALARALLEMRPRQEPSNSADQR